ncbi:unnamed protein product [Linum tenue]|uniref:Mitochondrial inner membrane protease subunit 2 n=1 Tax=Linum tenue TaxID=586396 RepID=A0AAV0LJK7_9ROSI|nr:unnamed protein product [Linum tenue]
MVSLATWCRYLVNKFEYSLSISRKHYGKGQIADTEIADTIWKNLFQGRLTYLHWNKGAEMAPTVGDQGGTLLVRKLPAADPTRVFVGDVVVLKDPGKDDNYLVRRLAAVEGYEMVSNDEKDEPFVLDREECWVLADNEKLKAKVVLFGNPSSSCPLLAITELLLMFSFCSLDLCLNVHVQLQFGLRLRVASPSSLSKVSLYLVSRQVLCGLLGNNHIVICSL